MLCRGLCVLCSRAVARVSSSRENTRQDGESAAIQTKCSNYFISRSRAQDEQRDPNGTVKLLVSDQKTHHSTQPQPAILGCCRRDMRKRSLPVAVRELGQQPNPGAMSSCSFVSCLDWSSVSGQPCLQWLPSEGMVCLCECHFALVGAVFMTNA
jgi:hypothetical protein